MRLILSCDMVHRYVRDNDSGLTIWSICVCVGTLDPMVS
jgi:hypothetical protein